MKFQLRQLYNRLITEWWTFEMFCLTLSTGCLFTITLLLIMAANRPTGSIYSGAVDLGQVLTLLFSVAKWSLLLATVEALGQLKWSWLVRRPRKMIDLETFDLATKGAWGSLRLLWRTRGL